MDAELRVLFHRLHEEVVYLFYRWKIFRQLFGSGKENLSLLNRSGSNVFSLLQRLQEEDVFLTLCRLADPERTGSIENLSIENILGKAGTRMSTKVQRDLRAKIKNLKAATEKVRVHRSKRIAHLDLVFAVKPELLPAVYYGELEDALNALESVMRSLHVELLNADTSYREPAIAYGCDGEYLLHCLRDVHNRLDDNKEHAS